MTVSERIDIGVVVRMEQQGISNMATFRFKRSFTPEMQTYYAKLVALGPLEPTP